MLTIDIIGHSVTTSSWYEIWETTTAIAAMCTRWKEKGGKAYGIGKCQTGIETGELETHTIAKAANNKIFLELSDKPSSAAAGSIGNVSSDGPGISNLVFNGQDSRADLSFFESSVPFNLVTS